MRSSKRGIVAWVAGSAAHVLSSSHPCCPLPFILLQRGG